MKSNLECKTEVYLKYNRVGFLAVLVFSLLCCLSVSGVATAADAMERPITLDIAAHTSIEDALIEWGLKSGFQVMMDTRSVRGDVLSDVKGTWSAGAALAIILRGTGLSYSLQGDRLRVIRASATGRSPTSESSLGSTTMSSYDASTSVADAERDAEISDRSSEGETRQAALSEVVVTAEKRLERQQDVPISLSVLGGADLDKSTFAGVTEALNTVPGVAAVAEQLGSGGTVLTIRGVSASGPEYGGASTVAYYVDSVPFGMIRSALLPDPNVYDLQQIEVLRGPQGTLYGANALNGVIRVLTNEPDLTHFDFKSHGAVSSTEGGGENYDGDLAVNIPIIEGRLAARAVVGDDHESGWIDSPVQNHINNSENTNARFKLNAQLTDELTVGLSTWHSQSRYGAPSQSEGDDRVLAVNSQPMYIQFNAYGAKINYDASAFSVSSMTSYLVYDNSSVLDYTPFGADETATSTFASRVFSEELNVTSNNSGPWRWAIGGMYRNDKEVNQQFILVYPEPTSYVPFDHFADTSKSGAVYGEIGQRFFQDTFHWTLGLRYFHDDEGTQALLPLPSPTVPTSVVSATSKATTPRAVLTWLPNRHFTGYLSYSQGFRSGVPQDELVGSIIPDFAPLRPDKLTNYEVGVKGDIWGQLLSYDAALFYMKWDSIQQQVYVRDPIAGYVYVLINGNSASGEGAELSLKSRPVDGLIFSADLGWNNLHFDSSVYSAGALLFPEGSRPNYSPEYTGGLAAQYLFPIAAGYKGLFSISGNYTSALNTTYVTQLANGNLKANSLLLTRARLGVEFPDHWTAALFVDNALNYNGSQIPYPGVPDWSARARPRTYGLQVDYHLR